MKNNTVEEIAEKIYNAFPYDEVGVKPLWQPGGNSNMQERARLLARDIIQHHQDQLRELNKAYMNYTDAILDELTGRGSKNIRVMRAGTLTQVVEKLGIDISDKN